MAGATRIGLIDCNNFFVSCERLFRPDLQRQPVLVLSANDGCVVARSQEVKDMGIPMGVPYFQVKDIIKDNQVQVFSGNGALYRDISRRVYQVVRDQFAVVQQYSIDECFFEVPPGSTAAAALKDTIAQAVGVPVAVGVARSKTLAKIAATQAKGGSGYVELATGQLPDQVAQLPIAQVWGVGASLSARYRQQGIRTVADVCQADAAQLAQLFGVTGVRLQQELQGRCVYPVTTSRPLQKSLMSSRSLASATTVRAVLEDALAHHVGQVAAELRAMRATAGSIQVSLHTSRHGDFFLHGGQCSATLPQPTNDTSGLLHPAQTLLDGLYEAAVPYRKVGVVVRDISPPAAQTNTLFPAQSATDRAALWAAVDHINATLPGATLRVGARLRRPSWQPLAAARSQAYTTRWADVPVVSAG